LAYDGMSYYYTLIEDESDVPAETMPKSKEAARKAIELDDSLVQPHVEQAFNYTLYDFDWPAAEREFQRAFSLNSDYAPAHEIYSWYLISQGSGDKAIREAQRAVELDPLSAEIHSFLGWALYFARRYDQAAAELHRCLELDPNYPSGYYFLGQALSQQGRFDDAIEAEKKATELWLGSTSWPMTEVARDYVVAGRKDGAHQALQDLLKRSRTSHVIPYGIATIYAALGDKDQAFAYLDQAVAQRSFFLDFLKLDPELDSLRSDPRFQKLLVRMKLN
jgi:tetratricopeptide (TPR) repeat protein